MSDVISTLFFKDQDALNQAVEEIEKFQFEHPGQSTLVTAQYLQENLEMISHAQDSISMYEKRLISDISALKYLKRTKESAYKNKINALISSNENKVSYIAKKTFAENLCSADNTELAEISAYFLVLEGYLRLFKDKKKDLKQHSSELKLLYKAYLLENKTPTRKQIEESDPYKKAKTRNPWKLEKGEEDDSEEPDDLGDELSKYVNINI